MCLAEQTTRQPSWSWVPRSRESLEDGEAVLSSCDAWKLIEFYFVFEHNQVGSEQSVRSTWARFWRLDAVRRHRHWLGYVCIFYYNISLFFRIDGRGSVETRYTLILLVTAAAARLDKLCFSCDFENIRVMLSGGPFIEKWKRACLTHSKSVLCKRKKRHNDEVEWKMCKKHSLSTEKKHVVVVGSFTTLGPYLNYRPYTTDDERASARRSRWGNTQQSAHGNKNNNTTQKIKVLSEVSCRLAFFSRDLNCSLGCHARHTTLRAFAVLSDKKVRFFPSFSSSPSRFLVCTTTTSQLFCRFSHSCRELRVVWQK